MYNPSLHTITCDIPGKITTNGSRSHPSSYLSLLLPDLSTSRKHCSTSLLTWKETHALLEYSSTQCSTPAFNVPFNDFRFQSNILDHQPSERDSVASLMYPSSSASNTKGPHSTLYRYTSSSTPSQFAKACARPEDLC